jgi:hypothetical protein
MPSERHTLWFARLTGLVALCALAAGMARGELKIEGETAVKEHKLVTLTAAGYEKGAAVLWRWDKAKLDGRRSGNVLILTGPPGSYVIEATALRLDKDGNTTVEQVDATVTIGGTAPPGPVPPGPKPDDPPVPPAPVGKLSRVLVVYESGEATKLPAAQQSILYGKAVRDDLNAKLPVGPDGKTKEWRIYDKDVALDDESKGWQALMARERKSLPWVVLEGDNGVAYEGPLPADVPAMLALISKHSPKGKKGGK